MRYQEAGKHKSVLKKRKRGLRKTTTLDRHSLLVAQTFMFPYLSRFVFMFFHQKLTGNPENTSKNSLKVP